MVNLRSKITQQVLGHLFLHEEDELYVNEMSRRFGVDRGNLVRKLKELETDGILTSRWMGNQRYYRLNLKYPLIQEYKKIVLKTIGLEFSLRKVLKKITGVEKAILFGSYAENKMDLSSDIDLLIIGNHNTIDLHREIAKLQKNLDREINMISMSDAEFQKKRKKDPLLKSIDKKKKIDLL